MLRLEFCILGAGRRVKQRPHDDGAASERSQRTATTAATAREWEGEGATKTQEAAETGMHWTETDL